jgi:O-antigen/teichoic acid export membrane protein
VKGGPPRPGRDAFWSAIGHFLVYAQSVVLLPLVIKVAGLATYGTYNIVLSIMTVLFGVSSFGAGYRARRGLPSAPDGRTRGELFAPQLMFQFGSLIVLAAIYVIARPFIDRTFLSGGDHYSFWAAFLYLFGFALFFQAGDYFRYGTSVNTYTLMTGAAPLLFVASVVAGWTAGMPISVDMLLGLQGLVYLICGLVVGGLAVRDSGLVRIRLSARTLLDDMRIGHPLILNFLTDTLLAASDRYLIAFFLGVVAVGSYQPAYQLGALIIFLGRIGGVVLPKFLALHVDAGRKDSARNLLERVLTIQLIVGIPFVAGSAMMAKQILTVLANPQVSAQSALAVPFVAAGCLLYTLQMSYSQAAFVSGDTYIIFRTNFAAAILKFATTLLILAFIPVLWLCGVTTFAAYGLALIYTVALLGKTWRFRVERKMVLQSLTATALMVATLYGLNLALGQAAFHLLGMLAGVAAGIMVYFAALALLGGFHPAILLRR